MNDFAGTLYYMAPEILKEEGYTHTVDIWAIGAITYELLSGQPLFDGRTEEEIIHNVVN